VGYKYIYIYIYMLAVGWTVWRLSPGGCEIFHTCPDQPWGHPASSTVGTVAFLGVKQLGRGVDHPLPPSVDMKERVELYLYSTSGPSWSVIW